MEEKLELCKSKGLCFKCTQKHLAKDCDTVIECEVCKSKKHVTCLHRSPAATETNESEGNDDASESEPKSEQVTASCTKLNTYPSGQSCGKIVLANVYNGDKPTDFIKHTSCWMTNPMPAWETLNSSTH